MKYSVEIDIDKPINEVVEKFLDRSNYKFWMEGLLNLEPISGNQGEEGAQSAFKFKMGNREIDMTETVLKVNLPNEYVVSYEAKGVNNTVANQFVELSNSTTKCITTTEFQFKGFMKIMAFLMPGAFKKQSMKYLKDFKKFIEN